MKYQDFLENFNITREHFKGLDRNDLLYAIYQQNYICFNIIEDFIDAFIGIEDDFLREKINKDIFDSAHKVACDEMRCHYERYKKSYKFNKNCKVSKSK